LPNGPREVYRKRYLLMVVWEMVLLFPPLARFFIGFLLVVGIVTSEALFALFIYTKLYGKE
jgi:ABC-type proline/glycine betaine transport system permease subunit